MAEASKSKALPAALNLSHVLGTPPAALDFVLPGFVRGTVGGLVSPGGLGKSYWALSVAVSLACKGFDLTGLAHEKGRVVLLSAEDGEDVLAHRLHALKPHLPEAADLTNFDLRSCVGRDIDLMSDAWLNTLVREAKGSRLIILDTLSRFHSLDENSTPDMKRLVARLERLAGECGAAVLYLHHTSKAAALNGQGSVQQAARGSSVLVDNARWVSFLAGMTEIEARQYGIGVRDIPQYVRWNISKQNYGAALADQWYSRGAGGILLPCALGEPRENPTRPIPTAPPEPLPLPTAKGAYEGKW